MTQQNFPAMVLAWENLQEVFVMLVVVVVIFLAGGFSFIFVHHFVVVLYSFLFFILLLFFIHFCSSFVVVVVLHSLLFNVVPHPSVDYRRVFTPILYFQSIAEWFATLSFSAFPGSSFTFYREPYGFEWGFFYPQAFFYLTLLSLTFLTQRAFIKASLGAGSSSLKFAGLHTDPQNTDSTHPFVWFTVIHNLHIQKNPFLNSTIYYHELLAVKSLVYMFLNRFKLFSLVQIQKRLWTRLDAYTANNRFDEHEVIFWKSSQAS